MNPEPLYRKFIEHSKACANCSAAGGEWAEDNKLCPTGRTMRQTWERAEQAEARRVEQKTSAP